jgi:hypothetical protein
MVDDDGLELFNGLSGRLKIKLTEAAQAMSEHVVNQVAPASARLASVAFDMKVFEDGKFRPLTDDEWRTVVIREPTIRMRGEGETISEHRAPDGAAFTVRDLADAIAKTEHAGRGSSEWFGGIDVHHVFFEGIEEDDGVWSISWGS